MSGGTVDAKSKLDLKPPLGIPRTSEDERIDDLYTRMNELTDQLKGFLTLHTHPVATAPSWILDQARRQPQPCLLSVSVFLLDWPHRRIRQ